MPPRSNIKEETITLYEHMLSEHKRLEEHITSLESQLNTLPEGKIFCTHNGHLIKWYHSLNDKPIYIPKKNRKLAEQLAVKKYFGLMDKPEYCQKTCSKLRLYISNGIIPTLQLITTYETLDNPLSPDVLLHPKFRKK